MSGSATTPAPVPESLLSRLVCYSDLKPCTTAFVDTRTPGSDQKENFTIIGPGVSESPDQYVHIDLPHGFNIGAARQPPGCINSQHSHETAEVFVIHSGRWAFRLGPEAKDGEVVLEPGDTISIPIHVFRGFENVGDVKGFMFAVLGGNDPGHVTWAPYVFEAAEAHGLVLLENGQLVDRNKGEPIPDGVGPMPPTTAEDVARLRSMTAEELGKCVVRHAELRPVAGSGLEGPGVRECPIIGQASPAEGLPAAKLNWSHGFSLRHLAIDPGAATVQHVCSEEQVILLHRGELTIQAPDGELQMGAGDVISFPIGEPRRFANRGTVPVEAYLVHRGDQPGRAPSAH